MKNYKKKALNTAESNWLCVASCPLQQCALVSSIAGSACNTMKQRGAVSLGNTASCFMEQCCIVWTDLKGGSRAHCAPLVTTLLGRTRLCTLASHLRSGMFVTFTLGRTRLYALVSHLHSGSVIFTLGRTRLYAFRNSPRVLRVSQLDNI